MYIDTSASTRICLNAASADTAGTATKLATGRTIGLTGDVTATGISFDGTANISLTTAMNVNYAGSASKGGPATMVATAGAATTDIARHIWFSEDSTETKRVHDDNFKYNPKTKTLTTSITGSSASCTGNAATATKLATSRSIGLTGDVTGSANFDGSANISITSTLAANYAGSSSKGGAATSANKLNTNAGSATLPVYFTGGVPKAINTTGVGISITGNAATATKLATSRTISVSGMVNGSVTFNGSANVSIPVTLENYYINGANTNNYPFRRFATATMGTSQYNDCDLVLRFKEKYYAGITGVCKISVRTNSTGGAVTASAYWVEASSSVMPKISVAVLGKTGENVIVDLYYQCRGTYPRTIFEIISSKVGSWTFFNSNEVADTTTGDKKTSVECYSSVTDGGTKIRNATYTSITESVLANCASRLSTSAGSTNVPVYINSNGQPAAISYQVNKTVPANAVFTDTTYSSGNGITIDSNHKVNHSNSAITAKTAYGSTATTASANGGSITVTDIKYDAYGHITGSTDRTIKLSQTLYTLPTAGSTLGGVKTTSTVTSATGYTACPIISGVPYYKDTNSTYTLAGLMGSAAKGSATQPVYWNGSAWTNTTYTLGKSVPANADFSNTWRGIQNNLTSTSTTDSLSAAQGKILKDTLDTKIQFVIWGAND